MKKLIVGAVLGMVAGVALSEMPQFKQLLDKGKEKLKKVGK